MTPNICNICNKNFNSEQELRDHQKNAHPADKKEPNQPTGGQQQPPRREDKIAS